MKITKEQILLNPVRLITLNEPYASLMAFHNKDETRSKHTNVRGLVCIHAAQKPFPMAKVLSTSGSDQYNRIIKLNIDFAKTNEHILSIGYLVGSKFMGDHTNDVDLIENKCYVKYNPDLWIWQFEDMTPIEPIKFKGSQGWSILTNEQKALIMPL